MGFFDSQSSIKGLIVGHLNIRSIKSGCKLDELKLLLSHNPRVHILCLSETWLNDSCSDDMVAIDNYTFVRRDRSPSTTGGGTVTYIHSSIAYSTRQDLVTEDVECICIELSLPFTAPLLLLNVYRPPSSDAAHDTALAACIQNIVDQNKECFILGDFNINVLSKKTRSMRLL